MVHHLSCHPLAPSTTLLNINHTSRKQTINAAMKESRTHFHASPLAIIGTLLLCLKCMMQCTNAFIIPPTTTTTTNMKATPIINHHHSKTSIKTSTSHQSDLIRQRRRNVLPRLAMVTLEEGMSPFSALIPMEENDDLNYYSGAMNQQILEEIEQIELQERALIDTIINYKNSHNDPSSCTTSTTAAINNDIENNDNNDEEEHQQKYPKPSLDSFIMLIENWLSFPKPDRAESVIDKMEELYHVSGRIYERVINAWSFEATESGLRSWQSSSTEHNIEPNSKDIDNASSSSRSRSSATNMETKQEKINNSNDDYSDEEEEEKLAKHKENEKYGMNAAKRAYNLLNRMEQLHEATGDLDFRPALSTYTSVINAIKRTTPPDNEKELKKAAQMMDQLRNQRDRVYNQSDIDHMDLISPHQVFYVLKYLENGNEIVERLNKKRVKSSGKSGDVKYVPVLSRYNFNIVIHELASLQKTWASQTAEEILDCMIHSHIRNTYLKPSIETFNLCMNAWAQSSRADSAERAEGILKKLNTLQVQEGLLLDVTPDTVSYNSIVKAHANNGDAAKAEEVLNIMEDLYQTTKDEKISPDIISYSSVLNAYAKAAEYDQSAPKTAEKILMRMIKVQNERAKDDISDPIVNVWSFNAVLNAYATQGAGLRSMSILQLMEDMSKRDENELIAPDTYSYNTVLKALANSNEKGSVYKAMQVLNQMVQMSANGNLKAKPDGVSYNTVILAIANHRNRGSGKAAERILQRMEKQYSSGDTSSKPTSTTFTSLIKAWTSDRGGTRRAEEIVNELKKSKKGSKTVKPDTSIYNALLNCYAKSGERDAATRAEEIIQEMLHEYSETGNESIKPNFRTYSTVIDIYSKCQERGIEEKALGILTEMESLYKAGETHLRPNCYTYASVINCFARSKEGNKAVRSVSILEQMEEQYRSGNPRARPNIVVYNSVLNACAYTSGEQENIETAFKIACLVFDEVRSSDYVVPTHVTYGTFIQVCGNFIPESDIRDNLVEATFKRCAQEGLVSKLVWKKIQVAASQKLLKSLQESAEKENNQGKWSRNT